MKLGEKRSLTASAQYEAIYTQNTLLVLVDVGYLCWNFFRHLKFRKIDDEHWD